ncbi:MAG: amino acid ABC transporter permease [Rhodocyclaceae bacterium]
MIDFTLWDILRNLLLAARWTASLSLLAFVCGGLAGIALLVLRLWGHPTVNRLIAGYVQLFQGTPLLMQLFLLYFGLALLGFNTSAWMSAGLALTLYASAYLTDIWRGCVEAVPRGQWEASRSLALSFWQQLTHVILPQAVKIAVPPTVGFLVQLIKGTALASVVGFVELTKAGGMIANVTYAPLIVYACVALLYFTLCFPLTLYARFLERKLHVGHR